MKKDKKSFLEWFINNFMWLLAAAEGIYLIAIVIISAQDKDDTFALLLTFNYVFIGVMAFLLIVYISYACYRLRKKLKYDDEVFNAIDKYRDAYFVNDARNGRIMQMADYLYRCGGKVDRLIEKGKIGRLYRRLDYLERCEQQQQRNQSLVSAIGISIVASAIYSLMSNLYRMETSQEIVVSCIILFSMIFGVLIYKNDPMEDKYGLYRYPYQYEKILLLRKLDKVSQRKPPKKRYIRRMKIQQTLIEQLQQNRKLNKREAEHGIQYLLSLNLNMKQDDKKILQEYLIKWELDGLILHTDARKCRDIFI